MNNYQKNVTVFHRHSRQSLKVILTAIRLEFPIWVSLISLLVGEPTSVKCFTIWRLCESII